MEDTPYTLTALRRDFGTGFATLVAEHMALDQSRGRERKVAQAMTAITSADTRVVALKMADRLHNMRTLHFMRQETQLRKAREVLDFLGPAARQFSMETVGSEPEKLASAAPVRARPVRSSGYRAIIALDIEGSTSRPDRVKAELRAMLYELFDAALRSAGIYRRHRDRFIGRGDGLLALIRPVDRAPEALLLNRVIPELSRLISAYNASLPPRPVRNDRYESVPSCTRGKSTMIPTDVMARRWIPVSACSTPPLSRRLSRQPPTRSSWLSPGTSTARSCATVMTDRPQ